MSELHFLKSADRQFRFYKSLGEGAMEQLSEDGLFWQPNRESNSIAVIVRHLHGNMLSRWTNLLTEDGEKPWRNRDSEFEQDLNSKLELLQLWKQGVNPSGRGPPMISSPIFVGE
ncbi:MAG: DUF1572 domain-containing protein [Sphingobacteriales bacterium]|nr:MAG: DUF1572 domain-containing protein [Sphingobacteriales bacterium]